jgi:hypothetical protein
MSFAVWLANQQAAAVVFEACVASCISQNELVSYYFIRRQRELVESLITGNKKRLFSVGMKLDLFLQSWWLKFGKTKE